MHNRSAKIIVFCRLVSYESGPESESAKFYRLTSQLRFQAKRSTPTDSNFGPDSDSAALIIIINIIDV